MPLPGSSQIRTTSIDRAMVRVDGECCKILLFFDCRLALFFAAYLRRSFPLLDYIIGTAVATPEMPVSGGDPEKSR